MVCRLCLIFHYHKDSVRPLVHASLYTCVRLSLDRHPEVELLSQRELAFSMLLDPEISLQSSCSIYTPISCVWVFLFLRGFAKHRYCQMFQMVIFLPSFSFPWRRIQLSCFSYTCRPFGFPVLWTVYSYSLPFFFYWVLYLFSLLFNGTKWITKKTKKPISFLHFISVWRGLKRTGEWTKDFIGSLKVCLEWQIFSSKTTLTVSVYHF